MHSNSPRGSGVVLDVPVIVVAVVAVSVTVVVVLNAQLAKGPPLKWLSTAAFRTDAVSRHDPCGTSKTSVAIPQNTLPPRC